MSPRAAPSGRLAVLAALVLAAGLSFLGARYPVDLALHHAGTLAAVASLAWVDRRERLGAVAFGAVTAFIAAHVIGARYLYSFVPYDAWSESLTGHTISAVFGFERNHYDRLVHFLYGLLLVLPLRELLRAKTALGRRGVALQAILLIVATSALYELLEWALAVAIAPESAERYNGQQGDAWDAHKDMALATLGACLTLLPDLCARRPPLDAAA